MNRIHCNINVCTHVMEQTVISYGIFYWLSGGLNSSMGAAMTEPVVDH